MSSVRLDDFPAVNRHRPSIDSWKEVDIARLSSREKKHYTKRKSAVQEYLTSQEHLDEVASRHRLSSRTLRKLIKKCLMQHEDGTPWGYRALLSGVTVIDHTPASISQVQGDETSIENDSLDQEIPVEPAADQHTNHAVELSSPSTPAIISEQEQTTLEDASIEDDDEDTGKREAIKIAQANVTLPITPIPASLLHEDETSTENEQGKDIEATLVVAQPASSIENEPAENVPAENKQGEDVEATLVIAPASSTEDAPAENGPAVVAQDAPAENGPAVVAPTSSPTEDVPAENKPAEDEAHFNASSSENALTENVPAEEESRENGGVKSITSPEDEPAVGALAEGSDAHFNPSLPAPIDGSALVNYAVPLAPALPYRPTSLYHTRSRKIIHIQRAVRKRWVRSVQKHRIQQRFHRVVSAAVVAALLFIILIPVGSGLAAYSAYSHIRGVALDGVNNLLAVKDLIPVSKSDPTAALNTDKLHQAQKHLAQAEGDFIEMQQLVNRPDIASVVNQFAPEYSGKLGMARNLVQVGLDVSRMGSELIGVALLGANILHASPLSSGSNKALITATDVSNAEGAMVHALYYINDIQTQMSQVSINDLPISNKQKTELTSVLALLPKAQSFITQAQGVTGIVSWLLGIGHQRRFLVQTLDSAELRPSGGFTGQYGIFQIQDGRVAPFTLQDVTQLDYAGNGVELNRPAPPQYRSWMTFGFWGLRDANLSGDYPTSARLAMQVYQEEGGGPVDGDISFTPVLISHILDVTGPIRVPQYNETITAQNLETKLHYYQQDQQAIQLQRQKTGTNNASTRKAFTSLLGKILLDKVRHLSVTQLMSFLQKAVKDIQSHDLEIYFSDPQAEAWLVAHGYADGMDTFKKQDGFMVVQSNISISKASQYVHTTEQDKVTLDAQGGATHNLTITLDYKQTGPVYGYDTYADYIRVYAPSNAQFISGDGFDTGKPLCVSHPPAGKGGGTGGTPGPGGGSGGPAGCSQYNSMFPSNARYCPDGNYSLGQNAYVPGKGFTFWPVDSLGAPTELTSDMPGRAMWGGLTVTPKNCISYISLSWYVPHVVKHIAGQSPYTLLVQKQGGYIPTMQISIDTSAIKGLKPFNFNGNLIADRIFSLPVPKKK